MIVSPAVIIPGISLQVCAVHPTGPEDESCNDFDHDPETEAMLYQDFLGVGEPVEENGSINNPWHPNPEEN